MKRKLQLVLTAMLFTGFSVMAQNYTLKMPSPTDYIEILQPSSIGPWTAEMKVRKNKTQDYSSLMRAETKDAGEGKITMEAWGQNQKVGFTKYGTGDFAFDYVAPEGVWIHLAFVCDGTTGISLYVNGEFKETINEIIGAPLGYIGEPGESTTSEFDEIRVWGVARTAQEIADNMHGGIADPANNNDLIVYYNFDDEAAGVATDLSANGYDGLFPVPAQPSYVPSDNLDFTPAPGTDDYCLAFDDGLDHVVLNQGDLVAPYTVEMWVSKQEDTRNSVLMASEKTKFSLEMGGSVDEAGVVTPGFIGLTRLGVADHKDDDYVAPVLQWIHMVYICKQNGTDIDGNPIFDTHVYVDGLEEMVLAGIETTAPLDFIGRPKETAPMAWMDEIRVWNVAKDIADIEAAKVEPLVNPASMSDLVAYYTFDDVQASGVTDYSASGFHGSWSTGAYYVEGDATIDDTPTTLNKDVKDADNFVVYPNPTSDVLNVVLSKDEDSIVKVDLMNITGAIVKTVVLEDGASEVQLNTSDLSKGIYIVCVTNNGSVSAKRIVKK